MKICDQEKAGDWGERPIKVSKLHFICVEMHALFKITDKLSERVDFKNEISLIQTTMIDISD